MQGRLWGPGGMGTLAAQGRLSWGSPGLVGGQGPALRALPPWDATPTPLAQGVLLPLPSDPVWQSPAGRPEVAPAGWSGLSSVPAQGFRDLLGQTALAWEASWAISWVRIWPPWPSRAAPEESSHTDPDTGSPFPHPPGLGLCAGTRLLHMQCTRCRSRSRPGPCVS